MGQRQASRLDTANYHFYLSETRRHHLLKSVERARLTRLIRHDRQHSKENRGGR